MPQTRLDQELAEQLIDMRRDLHQHPEVSGEEYRTTEVVTSFLRSHGIEVLDLPLKTGVVAVVRGQHPGICVAVRTDIDALPITEETNLAFASLEQGKMHACGHDFHTAAVLGAVLLAQEQANSEKSFSGTILFVFQPAEEIGEGAQQVIDTGVFKEWNVRAIVGQHNNPWLDKGYIGVRSGPLMGSVDEFRITVTGVGGHAAIPQHAVDPILVGAQIVTGLQHVVSRATSPFDSVVVTVGQFQAGTARNVIPPTAVLEGTVRCLSPESRDKVQKRITEFATDTGKSYGATVNIEYFGLLPNVLNDERISAIVQRVAGQVVGDQRVVPAEAVLAGEDFSVYQQHLPGCFFWAGTKSSDREVYGWHHPKFDVDESMIAVTSRIFVESALQMLEEL